MLSRYLLRFSALGYLGLLLVVPLGMVFYRAFEHGFAAAWEAITSPDAVHALWLTVLVALIAVPLNTIFGIFCALLIVRPRCAAKASSTPWSTCRSRSRPSSSGCRSCSCTAAAAGSARG